MLISTYGVRVDPYGEYISENPALAGYAVEHEDRSDDLKVVDGFSGNPIPVGGVSGWDKDFVQTVTISRPPLILTVSGFLTSTQDTEYVSTRRATKLVITPIFDTSGATASVIPLLKDKNGNVFIGSQIDFTSTNIQNYGGYLGAYSTLDTLGASEIALKIVVISSGLLALMLGAS
ncbi:MAG: hypothetical protein GWN00_01340 [Aliifodinibius sp.]|nr:hypothetical protein [Fodinibius sp.]NIV09976.1 hypothetical protein [Fodinibius sp.]NIY23506.1 hypothetical protein [Fodinibius sp.]